MPSDADVDAAFDVGSSHFFGRPRLVVLSLELPRDSTMLYTAAFSMTMRFDPSIGDLVLLNDLIFKSSSSSHRPVHVATLEPTMLPIQLKKNANLQEIGDIFRARGIGVQNITCYNIFD